MVYGFSVFVCSFVSVRLEFRFSVCLGIISLGSLFIVLFIIMDSIVFGFEKGGLFGVVLGIGLVFAFFSFFSFSGSGRGVIILCLLLLLLWGVVFFRGGRRVCRFLFFWGLRR